MAIQSKRAIGATLGSVTIAFAVVVLFLGFAFPRLINDGVAILIALSGIVRLVFWSRTHPKLAWPLFSGSVWTGIGVWAIFSNQGLAAISLALIIGFIGEGLLKTLLVRAVGCLRGFLGMLVVADLAVGLALLLDWPGDTLWAIPVLVACNIAFAGVTLWIVGTVLENQRFG